MKIRATTVTAWALAAMIGGALSVSPPLHAQESNADQDIHASGTAAKNAGGAVADSAVDAYHATTSEVGDAALTSKVKAELLTNAASKHYTIHVDSNSGTVTLGGSVDSASAAARVQAVVANISGVDSVTSHLTWPTSAN